MLRLLTRLILVLALLPAVALADPVAVLVEAEGFGVKGGWKVDTQSVEQMGSVYLLAHGLGTPVDEASTQVGFPETGDYRVWVRTRDWVPGPWEAPGRFRLAVDGVALPTAFGKAVEEWHWQDGGIVAITGGTATIALRDLTGFDGRCDAVAFIKGSDDPPPADGTALAAWRRAVLSEAPAPGEVRNFDCVVVGGGIAGCCAAYAAADAGISVALVQDRPFLGGNASQEIRVSTEGEIRHWIVDQFKSSGANRADSMVVDDARRLSLVQNHANITLFMPWRAEGAGTNEDRRIRHVDVRHTRSGARARLQAPVFIDCTGDAWVGFWVGAEYRVGREGAEEFGESRAPSTADAMTMGNSLMWKSRETGTPSTFPEVPWAMDVAGSRASTDGSWNWEYGMHLDTIADAEKIRDHLLRAIYGNFRNAKQNPANANRELSWVPYIAGKRESRRMMGDHIIIEDDIRKGIFFEDAVGTATWAIDLHYPTAVSYLSTYTPTHVERWFFPFRSLYSRNVPNLMMAGRCISVSHVGLGSPRVMNTTGQMGVAVGYAASLCKQYGIEPRDIYRSPDRMLELQARIGGAWPERPPDNPDTTVVVDNDDPGPGGHFTGRWTSSTSDPGYLGASYMHDGNTGKGTKGAVFVATIPATGEYRLALRWTESDNRASNVPVRVVAETTDQVLHGAGSAFIRITRPDTSFGGDEMLVGRIAPYDYLRGLLRFDLAESLPDGAVVLGAQLQLTIRERDATSEAFVGADGLRLYQLTSAFDPATTTWNERTAGQAWAEPGGDFDPNPLAVMDTPPDPDDVDAGDVFTFPEEMGLAEAVRDALGGQPLDLLVRTPTIESSYNARKLYRFASAAHPDPAWRPKLMVRYCVPDEAPDFTVDQRSNGGTWNELGTHACEAGDQVAVILGTEGTDGYVIADGVRLALVGDPPPYADRDGDLLPDWWERWHFLSETTADPDADADGDGMDNYAEFLTGTDPLDAGSFFSARLALDGGSGDYTLRWPSVEGATYRIESSLDLSHPFKPLVEGLAATPPENAHTVTLTTQHCFYRIVPEE